MPIRYPNSAAVRPPAIIASGKSIGLSGSSWVVTMAEA